MDSLHISPISEGPTLPQSLNVTKRARRKKDATETSAFFARDSVNIVDITSSSEGDGIQLTGVFHTLCKSRGKGNEKRAALTSSKDETFDLDTISSSSNSGSAERRAERPRKPSSKISNPEAPSSSSNEDNSPVKRRFVQPRKLHGQSPKIRPASPSGIGYAGSAKRRPVGSRKLDLSYLAAQMGSPNAVMRSLSSKPLEVQVSSTPESNQGTIQRRPGRPRKDPFATWSPISNPLNLPYTVAASESMAYESDPYSPDRPKYREYDVEHAMSNLVLERDSVGEAG
jgi:hypothetical protein